MSSALDLAEIKFVIAIFLRPNDLAECIRVCKSWYHSFLPPLWSSLAFSDYGPLPPMDSFGRHLHLIQRISFSEVAPQQHIRMLIDGQKHAQEQQPHDLQPSTLWTDTLLQETATSTYKRRARLSVLRLQGAGAMTGNRPVEGWPLILDLIRAHGSTLRKIDYQCVESKKSGHSTWDALASCSGLKTIKVCDVPISLEKFKVLWEACKRMKVTDLSLGNINYKSWADQVRMMHETSVETDSRMFNLRSLSIRDSRPADVNRVLWMMLQCPCLTFLKVDQWLPGQPKEVFPIEGFCSGLKDGHWKNLNSFKISSLGVEDHHLAVVLTSMTFVSAFGVSWTGFGPKAFGALKRHVETLTDLSLSHCTAASSEMVKVILQSCGRLQRLSAPEITAKDLLAGGSSWPCSRSLYFWDLCVVMTDYSTGDSFSEADSPKLLNNQENRAILDKLSSCINLRTLKVNPDKNAGINQDKMRGTPAYILQLRLDCGLDVMKSCTLLRSLSLDPKCRIEKAELEWILGHWPSLSTLRGAVYATSTIFRSRGRHGNIYIY